MRSDSAEIEWLSNPQVYKVNTIEAHSDHDFYQEVAEFGSDMPLKQYLNGQWDYAYATAVGKQDTKTGVINVPGHIELQGYDKCQYTNTTYPWEADEDIRPPHIPEKNAVSTYTRTFDLQDNFAGKKIYISFQGVESAFYLWINDVFVGYSEDSFTPSEFDVTDVLKKENNQIKVKVYKRSSASWIEDQDFWRFSGIFRDVYLYAVPEIHVRDMYIHASLDDTYTHGIFQAELSVSGESKGSVSFKITDFSGNTVASGENIPVSNMVNLDCRIDNVKKWSAECPDLYNLQISVWDENGELIEYIPEKIGFRTFEMKDKIMCINGKRIVFKGVNRHEFSHVNGRAMTKEEMENDIKIIKSLNINAVRTSHYPNNSYWYRLCDRYGIYLIDEANLESHGSVYIDTGVEPFYGVPMSNPLWNDAVVDRGVSMLERDKNHPSILIWSCGNESHAGQVILNMSRFFHERDPKRLVHYEGAVYDRNFGDITDMESRMYAKVKDIEEYLNDNPDKPYISCEYSHAMGNSCGALYKYTELEYKYPMYQGGFIWDFADQSILKDGEFMVGGDYGDIPNDGYFCGNGIVFADRRLSPKAQEVKALYSNVKLYPTDKGMVIVNENLFESTAPYIFEAKLLKNGKAVWAGSFGRDVKPGESEFVPINYPAMDEDGEYVIEGRAVLMAYREWANAGHVISVGQSAPVVKKNSCQKENEKFTGISINNELIILKTERTRAVFSKWKGGIISYVCKGLELIKKVPRPALYRAVTDNDRGNGFDFDGAVWMGIGEFAKSRSCNVELKLFNDDVVDITKGLDENIIMRSELTDKVKSVRFVYDYELGTIPATHMEIEYVVTPDAVHVKAEYAGTPGMPQLPEFGMTLCTDKAFTSVEYYGMGPEENYSDRCKGARLGVFRTTTSKNLTPYLKPQECGNREGVRRILVSDEHKHGIEIFMDDKPFSAKALPYSQLEIQNAYKINDLNNSRFTYVSILEKERGIGGDDTWGAPVHDEFTIKADEPHIIRFTMKGR